jgi:hypothetical protein
LFRFVVKELIDCAKINVTAVVVREQMFINQYFSEEDQQVFYSRQQASDFAKKIADDFNPLHDIEAKRFCVPGDLLFATTLARAGLHQSMTFNFSGMVTDEVKLTIPTEINSKAEVKDNKGKEYLSIEASGEHTANQALIASLVTSYVGFSGHTFPHILVALMAEHNVMINPARPMIIYESMSIDLKRLDIDSLELTLASSSLSVEDKRGNARLEFDLLYQGEVVGHGLKRMVLSGLRPYDKTVMDAVVNDYNAWKQDFYQNAG